MGVAGTVTTLTAQALGLTSYQPERIHGARLSAPEIDAAVRFMVDQPTSVKASLGFMPEGREDVIAAGALIWSRIVTRVLERARAALIWRTNSALLDASRVAEVATKRMLVAPSFSIIRWYSTVASTAREIAAGSRYPRASTPCPRRTMRIWRVRSAR